MPEGSESENPPLVLHRSMYYGQFQCGRDVSKRDRADGNRNREKKEDRRTEEIIKNLEIDE